MDVVARLVDQLEAELDVLVTRVVDRIRTEIPAFQRVPSAALGRAVRGNAARALDALREVREPTASELELAADVGRERAEQGVPVEAVLHAYRMTVGQVWSRFGEVAREQHADVGSVIAFSSTLWQWADAVMDVVAAAHRAVELEEAREEQQRRDGFVLALIAGTAPLAEAVEYGLDPEREYVCFRARVIADGAVLPRHLAGPDGLVTAVDHDLVGVATAAPAAVAGVAIGIGPPAPPTAVAAAYPLAVRALETAVAFGDEGVFALGDLSIRPAVLADEALGDAFAARYLDPLAGLGRLGTELEGTLRTWFDCRMSTDETARALHMHPNTLRHRLRRFEEATGADLDRAADLLPLWWTLERERLKARGPAQAR